MSPIKPIATPKDLVEFMIRDGRSLGYSVCGIQADSVEIGNERGRALFVWPPGWREPSACTESMHADNGFYQRVFLLGFEDDLAELPPPDPEGVGCCLKLPLDSRALVFNLGILKNGELQAMFTPDARPARDRSRFELGEILSLYRAINSERDIDRLLEVILTKCRNVTGADAGSLYLVEDPCIQGEMTRLRFKITQNDSVSVDFNEFTMDITSDSIVGQSVITMSSINIADLYDDEAMALNGWRHDRSFDRRIGYQSHSMLTVPLLNKNSEVIGVVQLINRKRNPDVRLRASRDFLENVLPFDKHAEEICRALAALAGIALENATLYREVQALFEGFVRASMTAVESRDPTTLGHSKRVSELTLRLAEAVNRCEEPPFQDISFHTMQMKEMEYASLLHDFGKIGVRERILGKPEKLYPEEKALILQRFESIRLSAALEAAREELRLVDQAGGRLPGEVRRRVESGLAERLRELEEHQAVIVEACRPTFLEAKVSDRLDACAGLSYRTADGEDKRVLTDGELAVLKLPKGTLTEAEREEMERHVVHTANFLKLIPWGFDYAGVPLIAAMHHEKMDGTGYPNRYSATQIPLQAKVIAVCDMFDALTSADRPYKKAVPVDRALEIILQEAARGALDPALVRLFIAAGIYRR